ncbi:MAG TPA: zf-HC2 domain-containing protein [Thermoanaerobaculia bacterium]|nr:zf-HC2 domain-containing protein [Thermoanaerobaculia bacterium]
MSGDCRALAARIDAYRNDRLANEDRRVFRDHLAECETCRGEAIASEPTLVFAIAPSPAPVGEAEARAILENVKAAIAVRDAARRLEIPRGRRAAAGLGVAAILALAFSAPLTRRPPVVVSSGARPAAPSGIAGVANRIVGPGSEEPSMPASATIYEWNPGTSSPEDPKIVWIVDRSLDL